MQLTRGQRLPLSALTGSTLRIGVALAGISVDISCFGLDAQDKLSDERYMVFFNQPSTPCAGITQIEIAGFNTGFALALDRLPPSIVRLVLVAASDGQDTMQQLTSGRVVFIADGQDAATFAFQGQDFAQERAVMLLELYRKGDGWRLAVIGQGFNGGLDAVIRHFGGEVAEETPAPTRVSLEKRVERDAPHLVSLAKAATISLEKQGLHTTVARVGVVLDASGSMRQQYKSGRVQELLDRVLPLALHFDDDGSLDVWGFDDEPIVLPVATTHNIQGYVDSVGGGWKRWVGGTNDEPKVIRQVLDHYRQNPHAPPAYVLFISDGGVHQNRAITALMIEAARYPIFWQFMGLGGHGYGILEKLDTMSGRVIDNCGFFAVDDLHDLSAAQLYEQLLREFPHWLRQARNHGIVR